VGLVLRIAGVTRMSYQAWLGAAAVSALVQLLLWLIPHRKLDERLSWDRQYVHVPMLAAAVLLNLYGYLVYEVRNVALMAWLAALLFLPGRIGFTGVVGLSCFMLAGYLAGMLLQRQRGVPVSFALDLTAALAFAATVVFGGVVFERLRAERRQMRELRRRLEELALTDALTGLPNRRQFDDLLRAELARIRRHGGRCCLAIIDVDHFKHYNDHYGHPAGDRVLRDLADVLRAFFRSGDMAARYGGEEFGVILFNVPKSEGMKVLERLRGVVESKEFPGGRSQPGGRLTLSAGVAGCPEDAAEAEPLLQSADAALYCAKQSGRNRVCAA
jgi:diguanylate cyclase (GGDEF)-like protein